MSISINIVFVKQSSEDEYGYVFVRTIENRIIKKKSLKIRVTEKHWNKYFNHSNQRFKTKSENSELYNFKIEEKLRELQLVGSDITFLSDDKKSFIKYWENCIDKHYSNHGTKIKHQTILKKLYKYLNHINRSDLMFKDITPFFLREFRNYLMTVSDPKLLSENSVNHYLKVMRSIIKQSSNDDYYHYVKSPFIGLKYPMVKKNKPILNEIEIEKLLKTTIKEVKLEQTRNMFLFQVFSNGMRVSDIFLLRWNNIKNNRLEYTMFKTGTEISIPFNLNMGLILSELIENSTKYKDVIETEKISYMSSNEQINTFKEVTYKEILNLIKLKEFPEVVSYNRNVNLYLSNLTNEMKNNMGQFIEYKGYKIDPSDIEFKMLIDLKENLLLKVESIFLVKLMDIIKEWKKKKVNNFIFPVLSNELFKNIKENNNFSSLSLEQYKSIKHNTIVYDRRLKQLQKICEIETNITSHVSRHSYTNLLLRMDNVNLYDVSQSLGHSSIKTTENYIRSGFNTEKLDYLNNSVSRRYRKD